MMTQKIDLHSTIDASVWAAEFCKLNTAADEGAMLGWFANAIMTGFDEANRRASMPGACAVSPVESVQSIKDADFMALLGSVEVHSDAVTNEGADPSTYSHALDNLIAHVDAKIAAAHAEGRRSALEELAKEKERANNAEGMAESMRQFRKDMIEAGVIGDSVPPMFMTEAILGAIGKEKERADRAEAKLHDVHAKANAWSIRAEKAEADAAMWAKRYSDAQAALAQPLQQEGGKEEDLLDSDALRELLVSTLEQHRMVNMYEVEDHGLGNSYPLIDCLSLEPGDIKTGKEEIEAIADAVIDAIEENFMSIISKRIHDRACLCQKCLTEFERETAAPQPSDKLQQASTAQEEPAPVGCPDLGDAEEFAEMLAGHGGMLAQAIEQVDSCMDETMVEPEDAAAWQIVKKHIRPAKATPEGADLPPLDFDERKAFEDFAKDRFIATEYSFARVHGHGYYNTIARDTFGGRRPPTYADVQMLWDAWEARAAIARRRAAPPQQVDTGGLPG